MHTWLLRTDCKHCIGCLVTRRGWCCQHLHRLGHGHLQFSNQSVVHFHFHIYNLKSLLSEYPMNAWKDIKLPVVLNTFLWSRKRSSLISRKFLWRLKTFEGTQLPRLMMMITLLHGLIAPCLAQCQCAVQYSTVYSGSGNLWSRLWQSSPPAPTVDVLLLA